MHTVLKNPAENQFDTDSASNMEHVHDCTHVHVHVSRLSSTNYVSKLHELHTVLIVGVI